MGLREPKESSNSPHDMRERVRFSGREWGFNELDDMGNGTRGKERL